jgi:hypothetical protein
MLKRCGDLLAELLRGDATLGERAERCGVNGGPGECGLVACVRRVGSPKTASSRAACLSATSGPACSLGRMPPYASTQTIRTLPAGVSDATARFKDAHQSRDLTTGSAALGEALNSAVSLEDWTRKRWRVNGQALDWGWRERLP